MSDKIDDKFPINPGRPELGEPLMMIHYNDEAKLEQALNYFKDAYRLAPKRPIPPPLVVERVA